MKSKVIPNTQKNGASLIWISPLLAVSLLLFHPSSARAQTVTATVPVGTSPVAVAVNPVTNKIYVANCIPPSRGIGGRGTPGTVTVIDGDTNTTTTVSAGICPTAVAVNPVTNKIYVANFGFMSITCGSCGNNGSITVIDGATNADVTFTDPNAKFPQAVAVNSATNKIYIANFWSGNITVIDGVTDSTTTVTDPNAAFPFAVAVNSATNKIYVANRGSLLPLGTNPGNVTVIDGATDVITTVADPNAFFPDSVVVNQVTNKIYVANNGNFLDNGTNRGNVTVIDGATNAITTITDPNAITPGGDWRRGLGVAVNPTTNKIYVVNEFSHNITVIDGASNTTTTVTDSNALAPVAVAVDSARNKIYVVNDAGTNPGCVTVIVGVTNFPITVIDPKAITPAAVALDPTTDKIYVANGSGNVTVIDGNATPSDFTVSVIDSGSGAGTVTSNPPGINCPSSCSASFALGTMVGLTASPASGSTFAAWSGACSSVGACNVTMTGFVTATFNTAPPSDFSLSPASASLTLQPGAQKTDVMTLAPQNGPFATAILLTCTATAGPAPMPTCGLNPTSVTPGANSATSTLTITAPVASATLQPTVREQLKFLYAAALLPLPGIIFFGAGFISRKQRVRRRNLWLLTGSLFTMLAVVVGCAGGSSTPPPPPPQNYTITITAASGAIQHTTQVTATVQ